jgi:protein transport protein HofC
MTKKLFYYQGSNALNQKQKGSIIADTKQQAYFQLISRGLTHIKLQQNCQFDG